MYECIYKLKKQFGDTIHELILTQNEVREVWAFYDNYLAMESVWLELKAKYSVDEFSKVEQLVSDINHRYSKHIDWGCDSVFAMEEAFSDCSEQIEALLQKGILSEKKEAS